MRLCRVVLAVLALPAVWAERVTDTESDTESEATVCDTEDELPAKDAEARLQNVLGLGRAWKLPPDVKMPKRTANSSADPIICVQAKQTMVVKQIQEENGDARTREYTFLSTLQKDKVAISPLPFASPQRDNMHFVFMEHISGAPLDDVLRSLKAASQFDHTIFQLIVVQILYQVTLLRTRSIAHRDLKPAQWVLSPSGCSRTGTSKEFIDKLCGVVLLDYDSACFYGERSPQNFKCGDNEAPGSLGYAPPKVVDQRGTRLPSKGDLWSLGAVILDIYTRGTITSATDTRGIQNDMEKGDWKTWNLEDTAIQESVLVHLLQTDPSARWEASDVFNKFKCTVKFATGALQHAQGQVESANTALHKLGINRPNDCQLYAALLERHRFAGRVERKWVTTFGQELESRTASMPGFGTVCSLERTFKIRQAIQIMHRIGNFPLSARLVSTVGGSQNHRGCLPVVDITAGPDPVVIKRGTTQWEPLRKLAEHAACGPLLYFSAKEWSFVQHMEGSPLSSLQPPQDGGQWEVMKLIVAQILLQLVRLQQASLVIDKFSREQWLLSNICIDWYKKGNVEQFLYHMCRVALVGSVASEPALGGDSGARGRQTDSFGNAIAALLNGAATPPEIIATVLSQIAKTPPATDLFKAYRKTKSPESALLVAVLGLAPKPPKPSKACKVGLFGGCNFSWFFGGEPEPVRYWFTDIADRIRKEPEVGTLLGKQLQESNVFQFYALIIDLLYARSRGLKSAILELETLFVPASFTSTLLQPLRALLGPA